ncbi:MAG: DUF58 domain-containing protein [Gammaproteobacteria bacterium]
MNAADPRWGLEPTEIAALLRQGAAMLNPPERPRPPLDGFGGELPAHRIGVGTEFAETKPYEPGDDPRHIHWRASARTNRLQVRRFQRDATPTACLAIDTGPSMRFGTRARLKVTQALRLATLFAGWELHQGAALSVLTLGEGMCWVPPRRGPSAALILGRIPELSRNCPGAAVAGWRGRVDFLAEHLEPGDRIHLISDFRDLDPADAGLLAALSAEHSVRAQVIHDPAERGLPQGATWGLHWGDQRLLVEATPRRDPVTDAWHQHHARVSDTLRRAGIGASWISTADADLPRALAWAAGSAMDAAGTGHG